MSIPKFLTSPYIVAATYPSGTLVTVTYATQVWQANNEARYLPAILPLTQVVSAVSIHCTTTGSGTFDLGIYDGTTRLASLGSTSLVSGINTWTLPTPMVFEAGKVYILAMSCSTTSATFVRTAHVVSNARRGSGPMQEASAHPLPSTATPVNITTAYCPAFALTFRY